jgi:CheY-like chemotaxis protein
MGSETILLTEDDEAVRRTARRMLEVFGYNVLEAVDGLEALKVCNEYPGNIHLLVTDTVMPNLGGSELAKRVADIRPKMRVLFTSGYTDDAVIKSGVLTSEAAVLQKPVPPQGLAAKVREVLQSQRPRGNPAPVILDDAMMSPGGEGIFSSN